jgi:hypothetical protein
MEKEKALGLSPTGLGSQCREDTIFEHASNTVRARFYLQSGGAFGRFLAEARQVGKGNCLCPN